MGVGLGRGSLGGLNGGGWCMGDAGREGAGGGAGGVMCGTDGAIAVAATIASYPLRCGMAQVEPTQKMLPAPRAHRMDPATLALSLRPAYMGLPVRQARAATPVPLLSFRMGSRPEARGKMPQLLVIWLYTSKGLLIGESAQPMSKPSSQDTSCSRVASVLPSRTRLPPRDT